VDNFSLDIVDVSDPSAPTLLASLPLGSLPYEPVYANGTIYLAMGPAGIRVIDVNDPTKPVLLDVFDPGPGSGVNFWYLEHADGVLFAQTTAFFVYDVTTCGGPDITDHPESQVAETSDVMNFSVAANGSDLLYQWQFNGAPLTDDKTFTGTQTPTLEVTAAIASEGLFDCVVTNPVSSVVSDPAVLAVTGDNNTCPADLDGSTTVDVFDLLDLLAAWGACP